jgi:NTP pyrophosphatase (non-canonical NTP hydrolase)
VSDYKAARGILAPTDEPAEVSIANARDEILKELSGAGISVDEVTKRVKEMGEMSDIEKGAQQLSSILGVPVVTIGSWNELGMLWDSTAEFHERFETIEDKEHPFIPAQYRAFMEEVAEFSIEVLRDNADDPANLERELADVIVVGMGLLMAHGRTLADLRAAMRHVAKGNDAKTHDTHMKNSKGKWVRKEPKS